MSRTKKDTPVWVTAEWWEPYHRCGWYRRPKWREVQKRSSFGFIYTDIERAGYKWEYRGDCDLPAEPVRENSYAWRRRHDPQLCSWEPIWPKEKYFNTRGTRKTKRTHYDFHDPQRAAVRDACRKAVKGEVEIDFPDGRTRSSVKWDMW